MIHPVSTQVHGIVFEPACIATCTPAGTTVSLRTFNIMLYPNILNSVATLSDYMSFISVTCTHVRVYIVTVYGKLIKCN